MVSASIGSIPSHTKRHPTWLSAEAYEAGAGNRAYIYVCTFWFAAYGNAAYLRYISEMAGERTNMRMEVVLPRYKRFSVRQNLSINVPFIRTQE